MKLSALDRLVLLNVLPNVGTITTIRLVRELRENLSFSEEEHARLKFQSPEGGGVTWDADAEGEEVDIPIGPRAHTVVCDTLEELNKQEKVTQEYLGVWDKFMEKEKE